MVLKRVWYAPLLAVAAVAIAQPLSHYLFAASTPPAQAAPAALPAPHMEAGSNFHDFYLQRQAIIKATATQWAGEVSASIGSFNIDDKILDRTIQIMEAFPGPHWVNYLTLRQIVAIALKSGNIEEVQLSNYQMDDLPGVILQITAKTGITYGFIFTVDHRQFVLSRETGAKKGQVLLLNEHGEQDLAVLLTSLLLPQDAIQIFDPDN